MKFLGSAAKTSFYFKKINGFYPNWKLRYKLKCQSTELELSRWLENYQIKRNTPFAIIAREQISGFGQNRRSWFSPKGGIWLSAVYPIFSNKFSSEVFSLSLAFKLCEMFSSESLKVDLKWPNDIFLIQKN